MQDQIELELLQCDQCECQVFIPLFTLQVLPAMVSKTGKRELMQVPQYMKCHDCGKFFGLNELQEIMNNINMEDGEQHPKSRIIMP